MTKARNRKQAGARAQGRQTLPPAATSIWGRIPFWAYILGVSLAVLGLAIGLPAYFSQRHHTPPTTGAPAAAIGGPAPGFSLDDPYGQVYTLSPGDGKAHLLVFYMGYF